MDARIARDQAGLWSEDPACGGIPGALTRAADALSQALPGSTIGLWANRTLPSSVFPVINASIVSAGRSLLSPHLQPCTLHKGRAARGERSAGSCHHSAKPDASGVSARCCYDGDGQLITQGPGSGLNLGGGKLDTNWLTSTVWYDVGKLLCCYASCGVPEAQCDGFVRDHPSSRNGDGGHSHGGAWNDPHWTSLGGVPFTYNGRGPHLLVGLPLNPEGQSAAGSDVTNGGDFGQRLLRGDVSASSSAWQVWALLAPLPASSAAPPVFPEATSLFNCGCGSSGRRVGR